LRRWTDGAAGAASRCAIELLDVLTSGAVISAAGTQTSLGEYRGAHTLANQLRLGDTGFLHLDQHLPAAGRRGAVIKVGAATE
jgi:hypothetical protein